MVHIVNDSDDPNEPKITKPNVMLIYDQTTNPDKSARSLIISTEDKNITLTFDMAIKAVISFSNRLKKEYRDQNKSLAVDENTLPDVLMSITSNSKYNIYSMLFILNNLQFHPAQIREINDKVFIYYIDAWIAQFIPDKG